MNERRRRLSADTLQGRKGPVASLSMRLGMEGGGSIEIDGAGDG
jgi:hypothetical protein